jgi:hypothetical protein
MLLKAQLATAALLVASSITVPFGQETVSIKDLARKHGGTATVRVNSEFPLTSIDTLVSQSALILRGRIENAIAHLTEDESLVLTATRSGR